MKHLTLFLCLLACSSLAQTHSKAKSNERTATLATVKTKYLNQKVYVTASARSDFRKGQVLDGWYLVAETSDGHYETGDMMVGLPASYNGKSATVVSIELNKGIQLPNEPAPTQKVNALGEVLSDDATVDPYFNMVVRFDDGQFAMTSAFPTTVRDEAQLASEHDEFMRQMGNLQSVVGKSLYAAGYSRLYQLDTTLDEMQGPYEILKRIRITDVPLLVPLEITAAKYIPDASVVVLKLKLPNGSEALSLTDHHSLQANADLPLLERVSEFLLAEVPKDLTPRELEAIKKGNIFRGMSKDALCIVMGFPKKENDWGTGGTQLIYSDSFIVYVDEQNKIVNWQSFDN